ncbi:tripartite tricarboxylate transporter substrate binding protein [Paucibacter sp. O1-1]|nr:tripartite tricarboxylate transporter substrate binding protein [Paucibacter sp. O1-1]MDA3825686.1 tripartite tricarboxylate transporter substrate binding protein [Paucibacter sp. O1-1]
MQFFSKLIAPFAAFAALSTPAWSQDAYPSKSIRMVVAFAPGGSADINARGVGAQLAKDLGATIVIDNKGGAGGNLGAVEAKRAAPDGYTFFYATSAVVLAPSLYASPGFDPYSDFVPVSLTATIPLVLVANKSVPAATVAEFITWAKAQKGQINYGSSGTGALLHLGGALFTKEMGIEATHIAYKGSAPAVTDLLGGATQFMFLPINEAMPHIKGGGLRALAVSHDKRVALLPQVPTLREATGKTTMDMGAWQGLMLPKGTPPEVVSKVSAALQKSIKNKELVDRLEGQGSIMLGGTQKQYVDYMRAEGDRWARVIKETGAKVE